jgi:hypothetical protein
MTQGVKDAIADAETLRKITRAFNRGFAYRNTDVARASSMALFHVESAIRPESKYVGDWWILEAARAAFRAVPGLRG